MRKLASAIAKIEGKKSQTAIGDIRETLSVLVHIMASESFSDARPLSTELLAAVEKLEVKIAKNKAKNANRLLRKA